MHLATGTFAGVKAHYRPETSDPDVLREVLERRVYVRKRSGFDVLPGERWLDLGANVGAFALYCASKEAYVTSYEPVAESFAVLERNIKQGAAKRFVKAVQAAVTTAEERTVSFYASSKPGAHSRCTMYPRRGYTLIATFKNVNIRSLARTKFDGIKMDIEGGEAPILDADALPQCKKLVLEYHTSVDSSLVNFAHRMKILRKRFKVVKYPSEFDKLIAQKETTYRPRYDGMVFAWDPK